MHANQTYPSLSSNGWKRWHDLVRLCTFGRKIKWMQFAVQKREKIKSNEFYLCNVDRMNHEKHATRITRTYYLPEIYLRLLNSAGSCVLLFFCSAHSSTIKNGKKKLTDVRLSVMAFKQNVKRSGVTSMQLRLGCAWTIVPWNPNQFMKCTIRNLIRTAPWPFYRASVVSGNGHDLAPHRPHVAAHTDNRCTLAAVKNLNENKAINYTI